MSKKKTKNSKSVKTPKSPEKKSEAASAPVQDVVRFMGVSLGGGKADKACIAVMEYYPSSQKLFLSRLFEKIRSDQQISADLKIHELLEQDSERTEYVAFDVPWRLPTCLTCVNKCPGLENCHEDHAQWMWRQHREKFEKKRPKKLFTPYTQRPVEMYMQTELEEPFNLHHAMGSNMAPLLARALFIERRLTTECIEVHPMLTMWRLGNALKMMKSHIRGYRAAFGGDEARAQFLQRINENNLAFLYNQDTKQMIDNNHAFEAFLCALTAYLKYRGLTEKRPPGFPKTEDWIDFPVMDIKVKDITYG